MLPPSIDICIVHSPHEINVLTSWGFQTIGDSKEIWELHRLIWWFSGGSNSVPQGTSGNVWTLLECPSLGVPLASSRQRPRMLLECSNIQGRPPTTENYPPRKSVFLRLRHPAWHRALQPHRTVHVIILTPVPALCDMRLLFLSFWLPLYLAFKPFSTV